MKISIFGGTGFVGSEYANLLKSKQEDFDLVPRDSRVPLSRDSVYFISTTDNYNVFDDLHKDIDVNLTILVSVLKNLKPGDTFNFISSWFVYGETELPAKESSSCNPKGFYSITKKCAEDLIISYCETFEINYRILRLCNVYGGSDNGVSKKKNALQFLVNKIKENEEIGLYHNGHFYRDYMHVSDIARAIDLVVREGELNEIYNIGSGEKVEFKTIIEEAIKITNSTSKVNQMDVPKFHKTVQVKDFYMETNRLKSLGFKQNISITEGIRLLCQR